MRNRISTKKLVITALMAALTVAGSYLRIKVPTEIAGTSAFHLGNIMCALSGILLGPWLGGAAAGIGSAIYDIFDPMYISDCWITFLTKGAYGIVTGLIAWGFSKKWNGNYLRSCIATAAGALTYAVLYLAKSFFYSGMLLHGLTAEAAALNLIGKLPATVFNAVVAIVAAPLLAVALHKALKTSHLTLD